MTVREWFRMMRAADFERAGTFDGWTLFDTQTIIDRETAAHYLPAPAPHVVTLRLGDAVTVIGAEVPSRLLGTYFRVTMLGTRMVGLSCPYLDRGCQRALRARQPRHVAARRWPRPWRRS